MKVICHCDDYGLTRSITKRIADAWEEGLLDGFSVVANGAAINEGAARISLRPALPARIAVHLNLYDGAALLGPQRVTTIVDHSGRFDNSFASLWSRWLRINEPARRILLGEIRHEWRAQIERVARAIAPRKVDVLDSHLHFHMLPFLFPIAIELAEEFAINQIRVCYEPFYLSPALADSVGKGFIANILKNRILNRYARLARDSLEGRCITSPDYLIGVLYTGRMSESAALAGVERCLELGAETVELLFHIGRAKVDELGYWGQNGRAARFPMSPMRDREFDAIRAIRKRV